MTTAHWGPFKGVRNVVPAEQIEEDELAAASNVDVNDRGRILRRPGRAVFSAGAADSLYQWGGVAVFRRNNTLYRLNPDGTGTLLAANVNQSAAMWGVGDRIYWSDGLRSGLIERGEALPWGIVPPRTQPSAAAVPIGRLPRGRYRFAVTFLRGVEESGVGAAGETSELEGGIAFSNIPVSSDATVDAKVLYLSRPNGAELYRAMILGPGTTLANYGADTTSLGARLETQFKQHPPPAACIAEHNGRMLLGVDRHLMFSDQYRHDLIDPLRNRYPFDSAVRLIAPVKGGVYVGTDTAVEFLAGDDIALATSDQKADYGVVPGSLTYVEGAFMGTVEVSGRAALFASQEGVCLGGPNGAFVNLTFDRFAYDAARAGAAVVRRDDGNDRVIVTLRS